MSLVTKMPKGGRSGELSTRRKMARGHLEHSKCVAKKLNMSREQVRRARGECSLQSPYRLEMRRKNFFRRGRSRGRSRRSGRSRRRRR